jgi:hypothetical protein
MRKKRTSKKNLSLWERSKAKVVDLYDWVWWYGHEENILFGVLLMLFGLGLLQGWLNPVAWLAWTSIVWGGIKIYKALK